jgi:hypothetical protein
VLQSGNTNFAVRIRSSSGIDRGVADPSTPGNAVDPDYGAAWAACAPQSLLVLHETAGNRFSPHADAIDNGQPSLVADQQPLGVRSPDDGLRQGERTGNADDSRKKQCRRAVAGAVDIILRDRRKAASSYHLEIAQQEEVDGGATVRYGSDQYRCGAASGPVAVEPKLVRGVLKNELRVCGICVVVGGVVGQLTRVEGRTDPEFAANNPQTIRPMIEV